jgi:predicted amidohydrolase
MLCGGSFATSAAADGKAFNTSLLFDSSGALLARYDKRHLFDVEIPDSVSARESRWIVPGTELAVARTHLGTVAPAICFDLRFPELFADLRARGAEILLLPAAFTRTTGRDHWEVLVRSRAIETQCYVLAANQYGVHAPGIESYGGSLIVDPWGDVLARAPLTEEAVLVADLSAQRLVEVRARVPLRRW